MPMNDYGQYKRRTKAGKELDAAYARHEIGYAYYNKIKDKRIYWEWMLKTT